MNPLTNVRNIKALNENDIKNGIFDHKHTWHSEYKSSAYIFIGGLPYDLTEGDVLCVFSQYGEIVNINLVRDKKTGKSQGYGFLCYEDQRSTILAVDNLNSIKLGGRTIRVDHVLNYRPPKSDEKDEFGNYKIKDEESCAPKTPPREPAEEKVKKKKKKEKKEKKKKKKKDRKEEEEGEGEDDENSSDSGGEQRAEYMKYLEREKAKTNSNAQSDEQHKTSQGSLNGHKTTVSNGNNRDRHNQSNEETDSRAGRKSSPRRNFRRDESKRSPPRKSRRDESERSPPRKSRQDESDLSPPRKSRREESDLSPPRKSRRDESDLCPPHKSRQESERSPPRKSRREESDLSPPRKSRRDESDQSPPGKPDNSPRRKSRFDDNFLVDPPSSNRLRTTDNEMPPALHGEGDSSPNNNENGLLSPTNKPALPKKKKKSRGDDSGKPSLGKMKFKKK